MKPADVLAIIKFINYAKIQEKDKFFIDKMKDFANKGLHIDAKDAGRLQEIYRYTVGGGERQDQQFKRYVRPKSWGV